MWIYVINVRQTRSRGTARRVGDTNNLHHVVRKRHCSANVNAERLFKTLVSVLWLWSYDCFSCAVASLLRRQLNASGGNVAYDVQYLCWKDQEGRSFAPATVRMNSVGKKP